MRVSVIVPFRTDSGNRYVYDDNTGMVFAASDSLVDLLEAHGTLPLEAAVARLTGRYERHTLEGDAGFIRHWSEMYGAFYRTDMLPAALAATCQNVSAADVAEYLDAHGTQQLTLVLTEDCNLRCRYCVYSDAYSLTRNRTAARMPVSVGRRALDYYFERVALSLPRNPRMRCVVGFYGGEPLMADHLRELAHYAESHAPCELLLAVTTNGTLLDAELSDFLVEHRFRIVVSLDGPQTNHDRNRVFPSGARSHERIVENLRRFNARHPNYRDIHLISVIDWGTDLIALERFFEESAEHLPSLQRVGPVTMKDTDYYKQFSKDQREAYSLAVSRIQREYYRTEADGARPSRLGRLLCGVVARAAVGRRRGGDGINTTIPFTGACVPGTKLAVRTDGTFDICERVNGSQPIGSVDTGIDLERVASLIRGYNTAVVSHCWRCPVTKLCGTCMALHDGDGRFERLQDVCEGVRKSAEHTLSGLYSVFEIRPDAFAEFTDINEEIQFITS